MGAGQETDVSMHVVVFSSVRVVVFQQYAPQTLMVVPFVYGLVVCFPGSVARTPSPRAATAQSA